VRQREHCILAVEEERGTIARKDDLSLGEPPAEKVVSMLPPYLRDE
jgi:hypothetical protein